MQYLYGIFDICICSHHVHIFIITCPVVLSFFPAGRQWCSASECQVVRSNVCCVTMRSHGLPCYENMLCNDEIAELAYRLHLRWAGVVKGTELCCGRDSMILWEVNRRRSEFAFWVENWSLWGGVPSATLLGVRLTHSYSWHEVLWELMFMTVQQCFLIQARTPIKLERSATE